jgi:hypothetical protein
VGPTTRTEIETTLPAWREASELASVDSSVARDLANVAPGARVDVYLGTWCGDSRREVSRLFRALESVPEPPFDVRFIAVDRDKRADIELRYVPTIVVSRDGREVGRIVESAPRGIERELLDLLNGTAGGVISGRRDL